MSFVLAALPIALLVWLMVARSWSAARAGAAACVLAIVVAIVGFGAGLELLAFAQGKGVLLSIWILQIVWAALFMYHLVDETGRVRAIGTWLAQLAPTRPLQVLILAWAFASFLQGIAGYGVPVAVVAPLMVANGFAAAPAVVATSIGHAWAVTFGSLGASYLTLAALSGQAGPELAFDAALLLGVSCLLCGAGAVLSTTGRAGLRTVLAPLLVAGLAMGGTQILFVMIDAVSLAAFAGGGLGLLVLGVFGRWHRRVNAPDPAQGRVGSREFAVAFSAYFALIGVVLAASLVRPIGDALAALEIRLPFPETSTTAGWVNAATDSYRTLSVLGDTGALLLYASLLGFLVYRAVGLADRHSLGRAATRTVNGAVPSSLGIMTMVAMALTMTDSGMTNELAHGLAAISGDMFPAVAPFIGALGAFMTGSNTTSNVLFTGLQQDTALVLGLPVTVILAAQTAGGAIGSMFAPAKVVVGCSTVGLGGLEATVLRQTVRYGLAITAVLGVVTIAWVLAR